MERDEKRHWELTSEFHTCTHRAMHLHTHHTHHIDKQNTKRRDTGRKSLAGRDWSLALMSQEVQDCPKH